jgi:hypothetical protein
MRPWALRPHFLLLPALLTPTEGCLLTCLSRQPDSYRTPFIVGVDLDTSDELLAPCSQGLDSRPQTAHATKGLNLTSMSGYDKNQQYVYGKSNAAHLTHLQGHLPQFVRMNPVGPT